MNRFTSIPEKNIYIAPDADVIGRVEIGEDSSMWYHSVVRADVNTITIGSKTNIQDGCIIHNDPGFPVVIGDQVTIGHKSVLHGCTIGDGTLIGMGSIILNGAVVGKNCIIGAGALITQGTHIPDGMLAYGLPAKVIRPLTEEEKAVSISSAEKYRMLAKEHFG